jgi:Tfp pilus assembly protein PilN
VRAFNLIPAEERGGSGGGAGKSGGGAFVVLGLLGLLAIFALLYGAARHQISSRRGEVASLNAQAQVAQAQAARLAPYVSFMALHEQRVQAVSQLVDSRFDWAHAFHELGRVLPKDASLASISGTIAAASAAPAVSAAPTAPAATASSSAAATTAVTSATPAGSVPTFTLSGCATSQAEVALTLDHLRLIDGVNEVTLQSSAKGTSSGGGGGGGGCAGSDPVFAMQVAFEPLPSVTATSSTSSTSTASAGTTTGASTGQPATSTGGAQ